jgi:uncharacterized protein (UPF0548 family)
VFSLRKPSAAALARLVDQQSHLPLTYPELGATARTMPPGYRHGHWETGLGEFSQERFDRLADALFSWQAHRGSGMTIYPGEPARPGLTFALSFRLPAGWVAAAGRVVYVTREPGRCGFAYGTLPGHPEQGEEAFEVVRQGQRIVFTVCAFSRPGHPLVKLGAPVGRALQGRVNQAYLGAMRAAAG